MNPYEQQQLDRIRRWQAEAPGWGTRLMAKPSGQIAKVVQTFVPDSALKAALETANALADKLASERSILKRANVQDLSALRAQALEICDGLARGERRRAMAMAAGGGAVFGFAGVWGLAADVPALLTLALRAIYRTGLCYGEDALADERRRTALGVFALASANSAEEKQSALIALKHQGSAETVALREGLERAAERELAKEAAVFSLQALASRIGVNLGRRKAAGVVPVLGMAIGAVVNAGYLNDVARSAQYVFQERWLKSKYPDLPSAIARPA